MTSLCGSRHGRRIMVCVRGQCAASEAGKRLEKQLSALIEQHGLDDVAHPQHTTCTVVNCLAVCEGGPVMIVHPEAVKYHHVDSAALEKIFQSHILNNQPVEELIVPALPALRRSKKVR